MITQIILKKSLRMANNKLLYKPAISVLHFLAGSAVCGEVPVNSTNNYKMNFASCSLIFRPKGRGCTAR